MIGRHSSSTIDHDDSVYYNILLKAPETIGQQPIPAIFSEERVQPILENPSDYQMAVARFNIPTFSIPIMFFKDGMTGNQTPDEKYFITMSYDGLLIDEFLIHTPSNNPEPGLYGRPAVYNYASFVKSLNDAFASIFTAMKLAKPGAPPTQAPRVSFDPITSLFTLYAQQSYDTYSVVPTIKIGFNYFLYKLFLFPAVDDKTVPLTGQYQLIIDNLYNNSETIDGSPYYLMSQEAPSLYSWNEAFAIRLSTGSIPVNPEFVSGAGNKLARILTDFELPDEASSRTTVQFFPQGDLRYYDLKSSYPMSRIDLRVEWLTESGSSYPIYIDRDEALTCKLQFRKKHRPVSALIQEAKADF